MIINPISKGGKGLLPEIIVTAPSGSTLDLMQGSVVLQTYTLSSTETQHTFTVKNAGTYTVRGTNRSDTSSVDVVIDTIGQYSCTIEYSNILKLYWEGDECESVTGGYSHKNVNYSYDDNYKSKSPTTFVKNLDNIKVTTTSSIGSKVQVGMIYSGSKINISSYSKLNVEFSTTCTFSNGGELIIGFFNDDSGSGNNLSVFGWCSSGSFDGIKSIDITDKSSNEYYFGVHSLSFAYQTIDFQLIRAWLE